MPEQHEPPHTFTIRISWKDFLFAFLLPGLLIGGVCAWGCFLDYYDEPGRDIWPWIWGSLKIFAMSGGGAGLIVLFFTLIVKDIIAGLKKH